MRDRVLFACVVGLLLGVAWGSFIQGVWIVLLFLSTSFLCCYVYARKAAYLFMGIILCTTALGMCRMNLAPRSLDPALSVLIDTEIQFEGVVVAEPDVRETSNRVTVRFDYAGGVHRVLVVAQTYPAIRYGDKVTFGGTLVYPEPFETETGRVFRYDKYLATDGVFALVEGGRVEVIGKSELVDIRLRRYLSDLRQTLLICLDSALPEPHSGLAAGLIAGGKQGLGADLLESFTKAGLVHIVVLSGYNVMLVAEGLLAAFRFAGRKAAASLALLSIVLFVLAAGAGPATIRAGIMASLSLFARVTGRTYVVFRALVGAVVVMVCINPSLLVFHPGFQLSIIATLGLLFGAPIVEKWFVYISNSFIRDICSATIAAQISVLPLLLYQTGTFSLVSVPSNIIALPVVSVAMGLSAVAAIGGLLAPIVAPVIGLPAFLALSYVIHVAEIAADLPGVTIVLPPFSFVIVILLYIGMIWLVNKNTAA